MARQAPTVRDTLDHWHLVTAVEGGGMETHGLYLVLPETLPEGLCLRARCDNPLCFSMVFVALGMENLTRIGMQQNAHIEQAVQLLNRQAKMPFVLPS